MDFVLSLFTKWHNAPFTLSIIVWMLYVFLYMFSPGADQEVDTEADLDQDFDHDLDSDLDHDLDHDLDAAAGHGLPAHGHGPDLDHGLDHDFDRSAEVPGPGLWPHLVSFLGLGRCPVSIILMILGISWGFFGLVFNTVFETRIKLLPPWIFFWVSAVLAAVIAVYLTRFSAVRIARWMPRTTTTAVKVSSLVGGFGTASVPIDREGGRARVKDKYGDFHNIYCRVAEGEPGIGMNEEVYVLSKLPGQDIFLVRKREKDI
ncbi:MAG: hypothetical protein AB1896_13200 [Thermodesulfobacteriota bacterium]